MSTRRSRFLPASTASSVLLASVAGFVALIGAAMAAYPGGTAWDATTRGNSFWLNYLCDLERHVALDGQSNAGGSVLAQAALLVLALGLVVFWRRVPILFPASARLGGAVRALGTVALVGTLAVALLPSDRFAAIDPLALVGAGVPSLVAAFLTVVGLAREERAPLAAAAVGAAALLVSSADFALYVWEMGGGGSALRAEAVLERVSLLLVLAWMCTVARRLRASAGGRERVAGDARKRMVGIALAVVAGLGTGPSAFAQSVPAPLPMVPDAPPPDAPPSKGPWYGWQILVIDGVALAAGTVAITRTGVDSSLSTGFGSVAFAGYILGGPTVHAAHGDFRSGGISLALRAGAPLAVATLGLFVGALIGALWPDPCAGDTGTTCFSPAFTGGLVGMEIGFGLGPLIASALDVALFSFDKPRPAVMTAPVSPAALRLAPELGLPRDASGHLTPTVGLAGTF